MGALRKQSFRIKVIIFFAIVLSLYVFTVKVGENIREKYVYRFVLRKIQVHFEKNWNAALCVEKINGNVFTNIKLQNVSLTPSEEYAGNLQFRARAVNIKYKPLNILFGNNFNAEFIAPCIRYNGEVIQPEISHLGRITTIVIKERKFYLADFKDILPKDMSLDGTIYGGGEILLEDFKPSLINLDVKSSDIQLKWQIFIKARGAMDLTISGKADSPQINGNIKLKQFSLPQGLGDLSFLKDQNSGVESGFLKKSSINVDISGNDIVIQNRDLKISLSASFALKKEMDSTPFLLGTTKLIKGEFHVHDKRFKITSGQIVFSKKHESPLIEVAAETKIRHYKIFAKIEGTINKSYLTLTSKPEATYAEIASLLVFGKKFNNLTNPEKEKLSAEDSRNILIDNVLLGKTEVKLTESTGIEFEWKF